MNIDEMPAGRELDALIAEKVFGQSVKWFTYDGIDDELQSEPWEQDWDGTNANPRECDKSDNGAFPNCESYSTDIAAAWQVVEKFRTGINGHAAACMEFELTDEIRMPDYYCRFYGIDFKPREYFAFADTAPLAICRAALKARNGDATQAE